MKSTFALILFALCLVSAENARGETLYPVFGPRATQAAPPVMTARFNGTASGKFTLVEANGESFQGKWSYVTASFVNAKRRKTQPRSCLSPILPLHGMPYMGRDTFWPKRSANG
jgi:hypothetical protein